MSTPTGPAMSQRPRRAWRRIDHLDAHPDRWLRIEQCAEYLQVSDDQVRKWGRAGVLVITNFGDRISRVDIAELRRFVREMRRRG